MGRPFVLASLVATLAIAPALAGDTKEGLGWKFTKGEKLRYGVTYNLEMKFEVMGMAQNIRQNARLELTQETKEIKDGVASIEATVDRVQIEVEMPAFPGMKGGKVAYDTAEKEDKKDDKKKKGGDDEDEDEGGGPGMGMGLTKEAFKGLKDVVGSKFTFKMARDGTISELSGIEEIAQKAMSGLGPAGAMGGAGAAFPLLDPEVLHQTLDLHCHVFPTGEAGDSWQIPTKVQVPSVGTLKFKRTITPKDQDKLAHAAGKPELEPAKAPAGGNPMMAQLGKPNIKDPGYEGTSTISRADGRVVSDELVATVTNEMSMNMPGGRKGMGGGGDEDEDEDAPKKKDDKKDEKKKDDKKKGEDEDEDEEAPKGGMKMKIVQKFKLVLKYDLLDGKKSAEKKDEKKSDE
ncbi:MAG: hypothetical protein ACAI25_15105 [Planctomycetota bacterium]